MKRFLTGTMAALLALFLWSNLVTYPVWLALDAMGHGDVSFRRVFSRVLMVGAFLLLIPLWRYWKIRGWTALGFQWKPGTLRTALWSFLLGLALVGALALWSAAWGHRVWHPELHVAKSLGHLFSAVSIGFFEETIFRGIFFLAVLSFTPGRMLPWVAVAGSLVFAAMHFFIDVRPPGGTPDWWTVWEMWRHWAASLADPESVCRRGLGLFLAGLVLCATAWRAGHLWAAVGLHAGWVFAIKSVHGLSDHRGGDTLWFTSDLLGGLWAAVFLAVFLALQLSPLARRR
ncbi:MAG: CPBP family intramembrane glutamic endopeptidase [Candidatus Methylacidiphilales bacterium]|nr:CPBP family intramembrane glutamic endopeptidase [Candidatus Methylacidiphilales bacterium]